ncbi:hypothetical protein TWF481_004936 [Arthrobotrys musiformis]|uniref:Peptidase S8/S53 domain-containing protein n=1 Tax=Arthrobotrys musiformis TaxID=47236 RepID=A0AAV9WMV6_9PEZI
MKLAPTLTVAAVLAVLQLGHCVPFEGNATRKANPQLLSTSKPATIHKATAKPGDTITDKSSSSCVVVLKESENRPWETILDKMGWGENIKETNWRGGSKRDEIRTDPFEDSRYFTTSTGREMRVFGGGEGTMRVLSMNMTKLEIDRVGSLEYVDFVGKNDITFSEPIVEEPTGPNENPGPVVAPSPKMAPRPGYSEETFPTEGLECGSKRFDGRNLPIIEQCGAPWGLERISSNKIPPSQPPAYADQISMKYSYKFRERAGYGVDIYIVDGAVDLGHSDFEERAESLWRRPDAWDREKFNSREHGTLVAAIAAGRNYGVAKAAEIFSVPIFGDDDRDYLMDGINAVMRRHSRRLRDTDFAGSVVNLSLATGLVDSEDAVLLPYEKSIIRMSEKGIHVIIAAGNYKTDACLERPARLSRQSNVISVGAVDFANRRHESSNWGECVDIYAPGNNVISAYAGTRDGWIVSGATSLAAPHVAGVVAAELTSHPKYKLDPAGMKEHILNIAVEVEMEGKDEHILLLNNGC